MRFRRVLKVVVEPGVRAEVYPKGRRSQGLNVLGNATALLSVTQVRGTVTVARKPGVDVTVPVKLVDAPRNIKLPPPKQ